jgi:hypothetical protein
MKLFAATTTSLCLLSRHLPMQTRRPPLNRLLARERRANTRSR